MAEVTKMFITLLVVQAFFSFAVTTLVYNMPASLQHHLDEYIFMTDDYSLQKISTAVQAGMTQQTRVPLIETGALLFYSGLYLLDLILNFLFAPAIMLGFLIYGVASIVGWHSTLYIPLQLLFGVLVQAMYLIGIIQLITGIRAGRVV